MKKFLLMIALIALIFCIVPVSAYTEIVSVSTSDHLSNGQQWSYLSVDNATAFTNAGTSLITFDSTSGAYCDSSGQTMDIKFRQGTVAGPVKGNGTLTFTCSLVNNWSAVLHWELAIEDFSDTGPHDYILEDQAHPGYTWVYWHDVKSQTSSESWPHFTTDQRTAYIVGYNSGTPYGTWKFYTGSPVYTPVASFTCSPTNQFPDMSIVCTDSSTNTPTDWYWTIDAEAMGIDAWQTSTSRNFTWESHYPGFYSVNLRANNSAGNDWENKSNYVLISVNATPNNCAIEPVPGYIRTYAQTNDGMTSGGIFNSDIQMKDVEGSAWSNVTNSGGWWCIDTLPGHSLNLYAQATGYSDVESIGVSANGGRHYLVMWPDYIPTPSAGNVTLYALIYDQQTGSPLYLSTVRADGNTINTILKTTGPEGQAMFTIKNDTSIHVTASKSGYSTITKVMTTSHLGPDTIMISLPRSTVTGTPTATSTPSWMTTAPTVGPGPGGTYAPGYTNTQGQKMMDFLATNGMSLVELCFFVTILALLGVKLGK